MWDIAKVHDLTSTTLGHIKAFLSGIFRYAKRQGVLNSENPLRDVVLPKAKPAADTYAYSPEEITQMLHVLPEPAATIVAAASFTVFAKENFRGFRREDFDGEEIRISQSYWRSHVQEPKTKKKQSSCSRDFPGQRAFRTAPRTLWQSGDRIDVSESSRDANQPGRASRGCDPARVGQGWIGLARLACFPPRLVHKSSSAWCTRSIAVDSQAEDPISTLGDIIQMGDAPACNICGSLMVRSGTCYP